MKTPEDRIYDPIPGVKFDEDRTRPRRPRDVVDNSVQVAFTIYLLPAKAQRLKQFCDDYLNNLVLPNGMYFKPASSVAYLIVMHYGEEDEPREVSFSVPVTWYEGEKVREDWALLSPFVFSQTDIGAIVDRELNGRPTVDAKLTSESGGKRGFDPDKPVLILETEVVSDPDVNQPATDKTILKIYHRARETKGPGAKLLEPIFKHGIKHIVLKQFRDADEPNRACYQAIVQFGWKIQEILGDISSFEDTEVEITQYANQPIATVLGLPDPVPLRDEKNRPIKITSIKYRPALSMTVTLGQEERETLFSRAGNGDWQLEQPNAAIAAKG